MIAAVILFNAHHPTIYKLNHTRCFISCHQIRNSLLDRAELIARASGGLLGLGSISKDEQKVLDQIEAAMS